MRPDSIRSEEVYSPNRDERFLERLEGERAEDGIYGEDTT